MASALPQGRRASAKLVFLGLIACGKPSVGVVASRCPAASPRRGPAATPAARLRAPRRRQGAQWIYSAVPQPPHCSLAAAAATASAQLRLWDQCGGEGGNCASFACVDGLYPGQSCPSGSSCLKQSNWYYQCLPTDSYTCIPASGNAGGGPSGSVPQPSAAPGGSTASGPSAASPAPGSSSSSYTPSGSSSPSGSGSPSGSSYTPSGSSSPSGGSYTPSGPSPSPQYSLQPWAQCGGMGGSCGSFPACADAAYLGYTCATGQCLHTRPMHAPVSRADPLSSVLPRSPAARPLLHRLHLRP
jgi:hypothetical protein